MKTLIIGASSNPERYSYKAAKSLLENGHEIEMIGKRADIIFGHKIETEQKDFKDIHTVTLYVSPQNQVSYYDYILSLKPKRVIFNPGTENEEFIKILEDNNILAEKACTLVLLSLKSY